MKFVVPVAAAIALSALTGAAYAADRLLLPPPPPTGNWAGSYIGGHAGYIWSDVSVLAADCMSIVTSLVLMMAVSVVVGIIVLALKPG